MIILHIYSCIYPRINIYPRLSVVNRDFFNTLIDVTGQSFE